MIMFIMTTQNVSLKYVCTISHHVPTTPLLLITVGRSEFSLLYYKLGTVVLIWS